MSCSLKAHNLPSDAIYMDPTFKKCHTINISLFTQVINGCCLSDLLLNNSNETNDIFLCDLHLSPGKKKNSLYITPPTYKTPTKTNHPLYHTYTP